MAYSPSPQPAAHGGIGNFSTRNRSSVTPPIPRAVSKRDKRFNALSERLTAISTNFTQNRDSHYRSQLQSLQLAMNYINNTNPYKDQPLKDSPNDIFEELSTAVADSAQRVTQAGARFNMHEVPTGTEMWVAAYTREINDAMESRDASLVNVANRYNEAIATMERDAEYYVDIASIEHSQLETMIRDRIYHAVSRKKAKLLAERETLDPADTNATLLHANHLSTANPASPGGPISHRKTRHTRHKVELDEMGTLAENNKKKRKGFADTDSGSPSRGVESETNYHWKEANGTQDPQTDARLPTIERLFEEKQLLPNLQKASRLAIERMSKRRKLSMNVHNGPLKHQALSKGKAPENHRTGYSSSSSADEGDPSSLGSMLESNGIFNGNHPLEAPAMDRTANSSYHATRSTGIVSNAATFAEDLALPGDIVGRRSVIDFMGSQREPRKKEDDCQRASALSEQERDADMQAMERAMEDMVKGRETKRAKILMSSAIRDAPDRIQAAEELIQESSLRETLRRKCHDDDPGRNPRSYPPTRPG